MIKRSDVTIIVPHIGGSKESEYAFNQCILSLDETEPEIERITVKNGKKCLDHATSMEITRQGQCRAVNAAVAIVNTPWVLVTNDDMVYSPEWFDKLTEVIDGNGYLRGKNEGNVSKTLCISPTLVEPISGSPTFIVQPFGGAGGDFDKNKWLEFIKDYQVASPELTRGNIRKGFNLPFLIKKELLDIVSTYDVQYDPWSSNSDSDLLYKIRLAGIQPVQNRNCLVYHFSQTSGTFQSENQGYWQKNWQYFIEKWGFPRTDEGIWTADFQIPEKERIFRPFWEDHYVQS